jgi:hypothetical protein
MDSSLLSDEKKSPDGDVRWPKGTCKNPAMAANSYESRAAPCKLRDKSFQPGHGARMRAVWRGWLLQGLLTGGSARRHTQKRPYLDRITPAGQYAEPAGHALPHAYLQGWSEFKQTFVLDLPSGVDILRNPGTHRDAALAALMIKA